jgi:hypothetical protein
MFLNANIDIPLTMPTGAKQMKSAKQSLPALLFLALSIFCLAPTVTTAGQQPALRTITITVTGEATAISNKTLSGPTSLNLTAKAYTNSNQWLIIQNTTGVLQIGSTKLAVMGGQGSVSKAGAISIFADLATGKGQLILQGTVNGSNVNFNTPSQLASTSYLTLTGNLSSVQNSGSAKQTPGLTGNLTTNAANTLRNLTSSTYQTKTQLTNSISILSSTHQNTTIQAANTTLTPTANQTEVTNTTLIFATSSLIPPNGTSTSYGAKHMVTVHVVQGQGEICLSSQEQMPTCTTSSQAVPVSNGGLVNIDATPDNGFAWGHYDGLGSGQAQNFNIAITQDSIIGVYFTATSNVSASATPAISPAVNLSTRSSTATRTTSTQENTSTSTTMMTTLPTPGNVTVTVTQYLNQTVSVTHTVAYNTISVTVMSTVANTTITQGNVTSTNRTTTVSTTVSTTTGP